MPEDDVEVPGMGAVRVRGLSRLEAIGMQVAHGTAAIERRTIALAMIDPVMTEDEVGRWQRVSVAGELQGVADKIQALSGMADDSAKEAYKSVRGEPDAGIRVLPGGEAADDGGAVAL